MATKTYDPSVNMRVSWTAEGVMFVTQVAMTICLASIPYILIRDEETGLLYPKVDGIPLGLTDEVEAEAQATAEEEHELGAPRPSANSNDSSLEECESPSSTHANTSDSSDEEWDEESLVHETYGRHTYNFGDTKLGPIYNNSSIFPAGGSEDDDFTEIDYP